MGRERCRPCMVNYVLYLKSDYSTSSMLSANGALYVGRTNGTVRGDEVLRLEGAP